MLPKLSRYGAWAWVINGVLFALYHTFQLWMLPVLLVGSMGAAYVCYYSKSIWPAVVAHTVLNLLMLVGVMMLARVGSQAAPLHKGSSRQRFLRPAARRQSPPPRVWPAPAFKWALADRAIMPVCATNGGVGAPRIVQQRCRVASRLI